MPSLGLDPLKRIGWPLDSRISTRVPFFSKGGSSQSLSLSLRRRAGWQGSELCWRKPPTESHDLSSVTGMLRSGFNVSWGWNLSFCLDNWECSYGKSRRDWEHKNLIVAEATFGVANSVPGSSCRQVCLKRLQGRGRTWSNKPGFRRGGCCWNNEGMVWNVVVSRRGCPGGLSGW